jgi:hypothetical protein
MPSYFISYRNDSGYGGELIRAADEATARQAWADVHESGVIESVRRVS